MSTHKTSFKHALRSESGVAFFPFGQKAAEIPGLMETALRVHTDITQGNIYCAAMLFREISLANTPAEVTVAIDWYLKHQIERVAEYANFSPAFETAVRLTAYQNAEHALLDASRLFGRLAEQGRKACILAGLSTDATPSEMPDIDPVPVSGTSHRAAGGNNAAGRESLAALRGE